MLVRRGLTLYWRWPCIWRFVFIGVDGTPRLGFVYMCDYDEREVYEFSFGCSAYIRRPLFCCSYIVGLCSSCTKTWLLINFAVKKMLLVNGSQQFSLSLSPIFITTLFQFFPYYSFFFQFKFKLGGFFHLVYVQIE